MIGTSEQPKDLQTALGATVIDINRFQHEDRIRWVLKQDLPSFAELADKYLGAHFSIVGSGPSAADTIKRIPKGSYIVAINAAHDWLIGEGILPHFGFMLDPRQWLREYQNQRQDVQYLYGTTLHQSVWEGALKNGVRPYVFIPNIEEDVHAEFDRINAMWGNAHPLCFLPGATTAGLRAINACAAMGAAMIDLHGFDSCYAPGVRGTEERPKMHAHYKPQVHNDAREISIVAKSDGARFSCHTNGSMARQIPGFRSVCESLDRLGVNADLNADASGTVFRPADISLRVWGDGAIPWMAWKDGARGETRYWHAEPERMKAKYGASRHWNYYGNCEAPSWLR